MHSVYRCSSAVALALVPSARKTTTSIVCCSSCATLSSLIVAPSFVSAMRTFVTRESHGRCQKQNKTKKKKKKKKRADRWGSTVSGRRLMMRTTGSLSFVLFMSRLVLHGCSYTVDLPFPPFFSPRQFAIMQKKTTKKQKKMQWLEMQLCIRHV